MKEAAERFRESLVLRMRAQNVPRLIPEEVERLKARLPKRLQEVIDVSDGNSKGRKETGLKREVFFPLQKWGFDSWGEGRCWSVSCSKVWWLRQQLIRG
jgi:hypothetical protein